MTKSYKCRSRTAKAPRRPFEKDRIDKEIDLVGQYRLKNKREVWRLQLTLAKIRKAARELLKLEETHPRRIFEGNALIRRMVRLGLLSEFEKKLDFVLGLTIHRLLYRRLQTKVFKYGMAISIHQARTLIRQRHIKVGKQIVDVPSFLVSVGSEKHIDFNPSSSYIKGPGRVKRRNLARAAKKTVGDENN